MRLPKHLSPLPQTHKLLAASDAEKRAREAARRGIGNAEQINQQLAEIQTQRKQGTHDCFGAQKAFALREAIRQHKRKLATSTIPDVSTKASPQHDMSRSDVPQQPETKKQKPSNDVLLEESITGTCLQGNEEHFGGDLQMDPDPALPLSKPEDATEPSRSASFSEVQVTPSILSPDTSLRKRTLETEKHHRVRKRRTSLLRTRACWSHPVKLLWCLLI